MSSTLATCWWTKTSPLAAPVRLFAFPCAGAEPGLYRDWPDLPEGVDLICAQLAGRAARRRTPPLTSLDAIVAELADHIAPLLDRPFAFFGHSMGGWVAYELARALQARGLPLPFHMVLSGSLPIMINRMPPYVHRMTLEDLTRELRVLGGTPDVLLNDPAVMALYQPAIQADFEAFEAHVHRHSTALPVEVSLWAAVDDPRVPVELMPLWRDLFGPPSRENLFEGGHMFILDPRNRARSAQLLRAVLAQPYRVAA